MTYQFDDKVDTDGKSWRLFDNPTETPIHPLGADTKWRLYEFPNGWGASVVSGFYSYGGPAGLWELAVTEGLRGALSYSTPITDDVVGYLDEDGVEDLLRRISELDPR